MSYTCFEKEKILRLLSIVNISLNCSTIFCLNCQWEILNVKGFQCNNFAICNMQNPLRYSNEKIVSPFLECIEYLLRYYAIQVNLESSVNTETSSLTLVICPWYKVIKTNST